MNLPFIAYQLHTDGTIISIPTENLIQNFTNVNIISIYFFQQKRLYIWIGSHVSRELQNKVPFIENQILERNPDITILRHFTIEGMKEETQNFLQLLKLSHEDFKKQLEDWDNFQEKTMEQITILQKELEIAKNEKNYPNIQLNADKIIQLAESIKNTEIIETHEKLIKNILKSQSNMKEEEIKNKSTNLGREFDLEVKNHNYRKARKTIQKIFDIIADSKDVGLKRFWKNSQLKLFQQEEIFIAQEQLRLKMVEKAELNFKYEDFKIQISMQEENKDWTKCLTSIDHLIKIVKKLEKFDELKNWNAKRIKIENKISELSELDRQKIQKEAEKKIKTDQVFKSKVETILKTNEEKDRKAKEEADLITKIEADRKAKEIMERKTKEETERKAKEDSRRKVKEEKEQQMKVEKDLKTKKEEEEGKIKEENKRKEKEEKDRKAKEEVERKTKAENERKTREEIERKAKEITERKTKEIAERTAKEFAEKKNKEEAERKVREKESMKEFKIELKNYENQKDWAQAINTCRSIINLIDKIQNKVEYKQFSHKLDNLIQAEKNWKIQTRKEYESKPKEFNEIDISIYTQDELDNKKYLELLREANAMETRNPLKAYEILLKCLAIIKKDPEEFNNIYPKRNLDRNILEKRLHTVSVKVDELIY